MSDITYIRSDNAWRQFRHDYLVKNCFCVSCEEKGKAIYATILHQPTPEEDKKKRKFSQYNLKPLCSECFYKIQLNQVIKNVLIKFAVMAVALAMIALLIKIIF